MLKLTSSLIAACLLGACATASTAPNVSVYKYVGSKQCTGGGVTVTALQKQLEDADVSIKGEAGCGNDGRMRPQMCGTADGAIVIFDIPGDQVERAATKGFQPLTQLPGVVKSACRVPSIL